MYALAGDNHVCGAVAIERHAAYDEVALCIGYAEDTKLMLCGEYGVGRRGRWA